MAKLKTALDIAKSRERVPATNGHAQAAAPAYRMVDRRGSYGWNNTLIESATQTQDRKAVQLVDYDFHRTLSVIGRRTLMSLARTLVWRMPAMWGAIQEQASLAVSPFTNIFRGGNKKWGEGALEWLQGWHQIMDLAGWPYNYESYTEHLVTQGIVDGDLFTLLTDDGHDNPRIQVIGSHRVGSRYQSSGVAKVRYEGSQLFVDDKLVDDNLPYTFSQTVEWEAVQIDGCILDDYSRPIAYRVYSDPAVSSHYIDISARNLFPAFLPIIPGQVRNPSILGSSIFDLQDVRETRRFEMLAQKTFASQTVVETNETGDLDTAKAVISAPATFDVNGNKTSTEVVQLDGGSYKLFKAGTGSKLEAFNWGNRPGRETQDFLNMTIRDAFRGTEWDAFFSLDPQAVGGAPMRVIVDRINRTLRKRRRLVGMNALRVDVYGLSKAIKNGDLSFDPDWYKWGYRGPEDVTADRRYDAQTDKMEYELGWDTLQGICDRRQEDWQLLRTQRETEVDDKLSRAKRLADKYQISIQEALMELGMTGATSFSMARRDTGDTALATDENGNPIDEAPPNPKPKPGQKEQSADLAAPITLNIENKIPPNKRKVKFIRDSRGIIGAEIDNS